MINSNLKNYIANSATQNTTLASKIKLGLNASLLAKRKASISALEDISNINNSHDSHKTSSHQTPPSSTSNKNFYKENSITTPMTCSTLTPVTSVSPIITPNNISVLNSSFSSAAGPMSPGIANMPNVNSAKEYVESLHQNSKSQLIYGKNHVIVSQVN